MPQPDNQPQIPGSLIAEPLAPPQRATFMEPALSAPFDGGNSLPLKDLYDAIAMRMWATSLANETVIYTIGSDGELIVPDLLFEEGNG